ncbi:MULTISPECIES: hypothetical protein [Janibacter]|uniref:hypothetical protein n=1 Tax=Janibacter TaxID=53457 RepID=UPI000836E478|nr:hypothetical protein [Janibacter terrae]HCE60754.1 hypothetical protein [Janibacter terrae]
MDADPIYLAPQGYAVTWPVLGGFILFGLLIWAVAIWLLTRRPEDPELHGSLPPSALAKLRRDALTRIDEVEARVRAEEITARRGHHELSKIVRGFVSRASGLKAEIMTAADLRERGPAHLAALIEEYYPRQFGADEADPPSFTRSAGAARDVVGGWS